MGILSWFTSRPPAKPSDFPSLAELLNRELRSLREQWFFGMLSAFKAEGFDISGIDATLPEGSESGSALKGYQMTSITGFAMKQGYISTPDSLPFGELLLKAIAPHDLENTIAYNERYLDCTDDVDSLRYALLEDLVRILWAKNVTHHIWGTIRRVSPSLAIMSQAATAYAFSDPKTGRKLKRLLHVR